MTNDLSYFWQLKLEVIQPEVIERGKMLLTVAVPMTCPVWLHQELSNSSDICSSTTFRLSHSAQGDAPWFKPALRA